MDTPERQSLASSTRSLYQTMRGAATMTNEKRLNDYNQRAQSIRDAINAQPLTAFYPADQKQRQLLRLPGLRQRDRPQPYRRVVDYERLQSCAMLCK